MQDFAKKFGDLLQQFCTANSQMAYKNVTIRGLQLKQNVVFMSNSWLATVSERLLDKWTTRTHSSSKLQRNSGPVFFLVGDIIILYCMYDNIQFLFKNVIFYRIFSQI